MWSGGAARFAAANYGCNVNGIDLTPEFVEVGNYLNNKLGLSDRVTLSHGNVLNLKSLDTDEYDHAYMMHVGMNIKDKNLLFKKLLAKCEGCKIWDLRYLCISIVRQELDFPVPWASTMETNACSTIDFYQHSLEAAGLEIISVNNRHKFAIEFFDRMQKLQTQEDYSPRLSDCI